MRVLVGVTSSIAAYKAAEVVSELVKTGVEVTVMMTKNAVNLVGPATFRALSGNEVRVDPGRPAPSGSLHLDLAQDQDVVAVVPATANIIGKIACGICDDLVSTVLLATDRAGGGRAGDERDDVPEPRGPGQPRHARASAAASLSSPETGWLACGKQGKGRLAETETIVGAILDAGARRGDLAGRKVVVTGGPTREPIDAVRFISNRSSGKMAAALARVARRRGAETVLVTGPAEAPAPAGVRVVRVEIRRGDALGNRARVARHRLPGDGGGGVRLQARQAGVGQDAEAGEGHPRACGDRGHPGGVLPQEGRKTDRRIRTGDRGRARPAASGSCAEKHLDLVVVNNPLREGTGFGSRHANAGHLIFTGRPGRGASQGQQAATSLRRSSTQSASAFRKPRA